MENKNTNWWKQAVIYQIYPKSFYDSNGDGIGDLNGITEKLGYLEQLGIDAIWLSPVFRSPQDDNGYDIADYQDIDPIFGSLADMDRLIQEAKQRGIRIIMDLVLNHSSDEHRWFLEARKGKDNPYHDYYVWRDGTEGEYPNDLKSCFGGPAWEWVPECGQYYLHQFSVKQPDLNWDNQKLRQELYNIINWWIDRGVGGFRLDVIDLIGKEPDKKVMAEGTNLHPYIKEMSSHTFQRSDVVTVGEAWSATPERAMLYSSPDGSELSMVFQFEHMTLDQQPGKEKWDLAPLPFVKFKQALARWQRELSGKGWNSLFLGNHDLPRSVSHFGDDGKYRVESAKMLATLLHGMQGTPYIYQGEELGMTNVRYDISEYRDIELLNMYKERTKRGYSQADIMRSIYTKGRDNARTPMQWNDNPHAGFTTGTPWIKCNPDYTMINAEESLVNGDSIFHYYQKLIQMRRKEKVLTDGSFQLLLPDDENIFAYIRENDESKLMVLCNFTGDEVSYCCPQDADREIYRDFDEMNTEELLLSNYREFEGNGMLRPYEAVMLIKRKGVKA